MARQSLGGMLGSVNINQTPEPEPADDAAKGEATTPARPVQAVPEPTEAPRKPTTPAKRSSTPRRKGEPKYLTLERKEARLTDQQLDRLTGLSRRINKQRRGAGERITDNTLIRVAVDLLLTRTDDLAGTTEDELRRSIGL